MDALAALRGELEHETASTRTMLERVPTDRLEWRPHTKSMSLGELATHLANLNFWGAATLRETGFDLADSPRRPPAASTAEIIGEFDARAAELRDALAAATTESLEQPWTLRSGDHVIFTMPRAQVFRAFTMNHIIHHRGQLSVYLRILDVPVPGMYGPSADDAPPQATSSTATG